MTTIAGAATASSLAAPPWVDLPADLLRDVSGRLHDAADFTRFHAVCKPWRSALPSPILTTFFPWLVVPRDDCSALEFIRCAFSKVSHQAAAPTRLSKHGWVARADGAAAWFFAALPDPMLVDPLTGSATRLPFFPDDDDKKRVVENSRGVIYDDGTTFLYNIGIRLAGRVNYFYDSEDSDSDDEIVGTRLTAVLRVAILFPGDTVWRFIKRAIDDGVSIGHFSAAYHDGKILLSVESARGGLALLDADTGATIAVQRADTHEAWRMPDGEVITYWRISTHLLESRGELLRVSVLARRDGNLKGQGVAGHARALAVSVYALEGVEEADGATGGDGGRIMKWARRDGGSLADRVLFLGFPTSFSVEAARFHIHGAEDDVIAGCVYFCHSWSGENEPAKWPLRLFRYSLVDRKAKFMEDLPPEWSGLKERCVWLLPQPAISPIEVIRERMEAPDVDDAARRSTIRMEERPKHPEPSFRVVVLVRNLPLSVDSSRVSRFFDKHGKVDAAEVISPGTARVTMVTTNKPEDAEAALDGLVMDGCTPLVRRMRKKHRGRGNAVG